MLETGVVIKPPHTLSSCLWCDMQALCPTQFYNWGFIIIASQEGIENRWLLGNVNACVGLGFEVIFQLSLTPKQSYTDFLCELNLTHMESHYFNKHFSNGIQAGVAPVASLTEGWCFLEQ